MTQPARSAEEQQKHDADLVHTMLTMRPWKDRPWARVALVVAAGAIVRGRHLTTEEQLANLIAAVNEAEGENADVDPTA